LKSEIVSGLLPWQNHLRFFLSIHHNNRKIATGNPTQNKIA